MALSARTVLVTGASSGFGLGLARAFAGHGWRVLATLRDPTRVPAELQGLPHGALEIAALDLTSREQIGALVAHVTTSFEGRLDCLVNNAGFGLLGPLATCSEAQIRRQLEVNFTGAVLLTQALLPALTRARGRIINISSMLGESGVPLNSLYCASKHALDGFSKALRHELAPRGVQVAVVAPGGFRTRFRDNLQWGELPDADPVAQRQSAALRALLARRGARPGPDAQPVVDAVIALAQRRRIPAVVRVGRDAQLVHALYRVLPRSWADAVLGRIFQRLLLERQGHDG
jgi:NAD(P)-dependent dehydrogenase (short-subunit alcohol dehydrogenase family)